MNRARPCWIKVFLLKTSFTDPKLLYISALLSYQIIFDKKNIVSSKNKNSKYRTKNDTLQWNLSTFTPAYFESLSLPFLILTHYSTSFYSKKKKVCSHKKAVRCSALWVMSTPIILYRTKCAGNFMHSRVAT